MDDGRRGGPPRRVVGLVGAVVAVLALVAGGVLGWRAYRDATRSDLDRALAWTPTSTERFAWTDWAGVRQALSSDVDAESSGLEVTEMLNEGYDADLTSTTAMVESSEVLQESFGVSPATASWELLAQSPDGAVDLIGVPDGFSFGDFEGRLDDLGYARPDEEGGVWTGGEELIASIAAGRSVSPQYAHWAVDRDRHLLLAGDDDVYVERALEAVAEESGGEPVADVAGALEEQPLSALLLDGRQACRGLAMSQADDVDRAVADELVAAAGEVNPLSGFALAALADGSVVAAMSFESDEQARTNADTRATLASGAAPGQGGDFADRFTLGTVEADGRVVTMRLDPVDGAPVLSDLSSGPVLFATC